MERPFARTYSTEVAGELLVYDVERLWSLARDLPERDVAIASLESQLRAACWFPPGHSPTCLEVVEHARRIYDADFGHPIILSARGEVMDGMHRVARAWMLGVLTVRAVRFERDPEPDFRRPRPPR